MPAISRFSRSWGDLPVNMGVLEARSDEESTRAVIETGIVLQDLDGADAATPGCAEMGSHGGPGLLNEINIAPFPGGPQVA